MHAGLTAKVRRKSFVSYRSEAASHRPSCEIAEVRRFVRNCLHQSSLFMICRIERTLRSISNTLFHPCSSGKTLQIPIDRSFRVTTIRPPRLTEILPDPKGLVLRVNASSKTTLLNPFNRPSGFRVFDDASGAAAGVRMRDISHPPEARIGAIEGFVGSERGE